MKSVIAIQFAANSILVAFWAVFFHSSLEKRFGKWLTAAVWAVTAVAWPHLRGLIAYGPAVSVFLGALAIIPVVVLLYKSHWTRILSSFIFAQAAAALSYFLIVLLFPQVRELPVYSQSVDATALTQVSVYLVFLPLNGVLLYLAALLSNGYKNRRGGHGWILYSLFPLSQIVVCLVWFALLIRVGNKLASLWQGIAIIVCTAADIGLYFAMDGMAQRASLAAEKTVLERQIDAEKAHYAAIAEQYEAVRRTRHDIANHVYTIQILLEKGETAQAAAYAAEFGEKEAETDAAHCDL
jgi:hypothetical protein